MKKLLLMIPLTIVLVLSLTLTSFAASSSPSSGEFPVYAPSQAPLQFSFAVGDYPKSEGLQVPTKYNLFMDVGSPVVSSGTTYSNIKLWNNSLGIQYSFRTAVSVGDGVNGLSLSKGTDIDRLDTIYPEFSATGQNYVFDPALVQGFYRPTALNLDTSHIVSMNDLIHQKVTYSGTILYPTTDGTFVSVPFSYEDEVYSGAVDSVYLYKYVFSGNDPTEGSIIDKVIVSEYPVASGYGCSLVPSDLTLNGKADKLSLHHIYSIAWDNASELGITNLITPTALAEHRVPIVFSNYSLSYFIEGATVLRSSDVGTPDSITNRFFVPHDITCSGFNITLPSTLNGSPRDNETFTEFMYKVAPEQIDPEFSMITFVTTILSGVLTVELFPGFFLYTALSVVVAISLITWLLKVFAGG